MTILVAGYQGFIGKNIFEHLKKSYKVDGVTRNDILLDKNYDVIVHCAATTPNNVKNNFDFIENNINYTKKLIDKYKNSKFIFFSTRDIYGIPNVEIIYEDTIPYNQSIYGMSKYLAEKLIEENINEYVIFRLPAVLGLKSSPTFITQLADKLEANEQIILYDNNRFNSVVLIDDIKRLVDIYLKNKLDIGLYNIASSKYITIKEIVDLLSFQLKISLSNIVYKKSLTTNEISINKISPYISFLSTYDTIQQYIYNYRSK